MLPAPSVSSRASSGRKLGLHGKTELVWSQRKVTRSISCFEHLLTQRRKIYVVRYASRTLPIDHDVTFALERDFDDNEDEEDAQVGPSKKKDEPIPDSKLAPEIQASSPTS